eukprot:g2883.t1
MGRKPRLSNGATVQVMKNPAPVALTNWQRGSLRFHPVRLWFSEIYWLTVGADAVGERIKGLQGALLRQLTGKGMDNDGQDEHERQGMLVAAIMKKKRALLVLDDPWIPEQVRFLNPIDEGAHTEHRLLVTTRIRDLVPKAARVELPLMGKDEAVMLLLGLANIDEADYLKEHSQSAWPPQAAYTIAAECGLLPITLTIAAQVVRNWGSGWEVAVLPLLREKEGAGASTVEERVIGAGLQALDKNEDGAAVKELFHMFAVTREDFVHPMAVVELLWRSCCASESEKAEGSLTTRLKVRQWTQMLVDHSLLLGSSSEGIHLHDIILHYLRKRLSVDEMRAAQGKVVDGMVAASQARKAATGKALQDTGATPAAFDGEEVDWYCCNVGAFHVKQSLDPELPLVENADLKALLLQDDEVLARQAAIAIGDEGLRVLGAHYMQSEMFFEAAKLKWTTASMESLFTGLGVTLMEDALSLLRQDGGRSRAAVQALELRVLMTLGWSIGGTSPKRPAILSRIAEVRKGNPALPVEPWHVINTELFIPCMLLCGHTAAAYDDPDNPVTDESRLKGFQQLSGGLSLMEEAVAGAVGARKEVLEFYKLAVSTMYYHVAQNTEEGVRVVQATTEKILGADCRSMMHAICSHRFERHFTLSRLVGTGLGPSTNGYTSGVAPEKTGDIQMHVDATDIQNKWMLAYARASPAPGYEHVGVLHKAGDRIGLELSPHYPSLAQDFLRVYASYGINSPSEFLEAYKTSAEYARNRQNVRSSADGRHHRYHSHNPVALAGCIF